MKIFDKWKSWSEAKRGVEIKLSSNVLKDLDRAFLWAIEYHDGQTRPNGDPYVIHLLEVIEILIEGAGVVEGEILQAAVLHDIVEDTACSLDQIRAKFGNQIEILVSWLTKPAPSNVQSNQQQEDEYFARLKSAPREAILIKLADRLSNVQKLNTHPRLEKQKSYYLETIEKIIPLAEDLPWFNQRFQEWRERFSYLAS